MHNDFLFMKLYDNIFNYNTDNLEFMRGCKDNQFDWGISDPNYGIGASRPSKKPGKVKQKNGSILQAPLNDYEHKDWDDKHPPEIYFKEFKRVTKNQIIWGVNYYSFNLKGGRLVWDKLNGESDQFDCEIAYLSFTLRTEMVYYKWSGMMQGKKASSKVREAYAQQGNKALNEKRIHPTQKPVLLYKWILDKWVKPGESIFDSHSGSLSLAIAAFLHGCPFTGTDTDIDYFTEGNDRVIQFTDKENARIFHCA